MNAYEYTAITTDKKRIQGEEAREKGGERK